MYFLRKIGSLITNDWWTYLLLHKCILRIITSSILLSCFNSGHSTNIRNKEDLMYTSFDALTTIGSKIDNFSSTAIYFWQLSIATPCMQFFSTFNFIQYSLLQFIIVSMLHMAYILCVAVLPLTYCPHKVSKVSAEKRCLPLVSFGFFPPLKSLAKFTEV